MNDLPALAARVRDELAQAVSTRGHPWRTATLATVSPDGLPDARTVVLREWDEHEQALVFFTDARSPKVQHLQHQPQAVLVLWSPALGWQLRMTVRTEVTFEGLGVTSRWARLKMSPAAQDYLSPQAPGESLQDMSPAGVSRPHFAVVHARVLAMDWLSLTPEGHRRARLSPLKSAAWLQP
ncbi:MAG: pyridoxamine 5'-phosphate oxidase family protein [Ideonella sp.]|nr:pyridoxamine 5'-phosphate oxidase family protein [Ideonella sp.]